MEQYDTAAPGQETRAALFCGSVNLNQLKMISYCPIRGLHKPMECTQNEEQPKQSR